MRNLRPIKGRRLPPQDLTVNRDVFLQWVAKYGRERALEIAAHRMEERQAEDGSKLLAEIAQQDWDMYCKISDYVVRRIQINIAKDSRTGKYILLTGATG